MQTLAQISEVVMKHKKKSLSLCENHPSRFHFLKKKAQLQLKQKKENKSMLIATF